MIEIETIEAFDAHIQEGLPLKDVVLQSLDLRQRTAQLAPFDLSGVVFLGCLLSEETQHQAFEQRALLFPNIQGILYSTYRPHLYTPAELFNDFDPEHPETYAQTLDARIYAHWKDTGKSQPQNIMETLARRLHDHSITNAMEDLLRRGPDGKARKVVAIMGGHSMPRNRGHYLTVARMARILTQKGFFMVSGGGPGAMEATHLGAWFATRSEDELAEAVDLLSTAPSYKDERWLSRAFQVRMCFPLSDEDRPKCASMGIPTWHYGHEPPNPFATHIAKYFANSVREDGLLTIAKHGIIFSPGSAGTIQEVFQDACQNHYNTVGVISPMIFFGEGYWTWNKPVFPLLAQLAAGRPYARWLSITDDPDQAIRTIEEFDAVTPID